MSKSQKQMHAVMVPETFNAEAVLAVKTGRSSKTLRRAWALVSGVARVVEEGGADPLVTEKVKSVSAQVEEVAQACAALLAMAPERDAKEAAFRVVNAAIIAADQRIVELIGQTNLQLKGLLGPKSPALTLLGMAPRRPQPRGAARKPRAKKGTAKAPATTSTPQPA